MKTMMKRDRQWWSARSPRHLLAEDLLHRLLGEAQLLQEEGDHLLHQLELAVELLDLHPVEVHRLLHKLEHPLSKIL